MPTLALASATAEFGETKLIFLKISFSKKKLFFWKNCRKETFLSARASHWRIHTMPGDRKYIVFLPVFYAKKDVERRGKFFNPLKNNSDCYQRIHIRESKSLFIECTSINENFYVTVVKIHSRFARKMFVMLEYYNFIVNNFCKKKLFAAKTRENLFWQKKKKKMYYC